MRTKWGLFPYTAVEYKAAQDYLDRKAEKGWELDHVYLGLFARFREAEQPRHAVCLDVRKRWDSDTDPEYLQLCREAGWDFLQSRQGMLLFRAAPGARPVPLQTDGEIERQEFWKRRARGDLIAYLLCLALLIGFVWMITQKGVLTTVVTSNWQLSRFLPIVISGIGILWSMIWEPLYLLRCRKAEKMEAPGRRSAFLRSILIWLYVPLLFLSLFMGTAEVMGAGKTVDLSLDPLSQYGQEMATPEACREWPVVLAEDLGLPPSENSRYLDGTRSVLVDFLRYSEITSLEGEAGHPILTTERYDCVGTGLARWLLDQRKRETAQGNFLWGVLDWQEAPGLGFEESYTCREGSYLLLRQGKVTALVGCSEVDLTTAEHLAVIRERLDL